VFEPGSKRFSFFSQKRGSRWHRELFRLYWKRRSKASSHRPKVASETIALIREMARENRLWGAERIRGELLKLGIRVCKRTIGEVHEDCSHSPAKRTEVGNFSAQSRRTDLGL
jgi:transposase